MLMLISWLALRVKPGLGTLCNMMFVGPWVDLLRVQRWMPHYPGGLSGSVQFLVGLLIIGLASAVYLGAGLGAGPRDGFVLGLSRRLEKSLRATRIAVEVVVLGIAVWLGGAIGLGTVIFAVLMGPIMQAALRLFAVSHDPSPTWRMRPSP